MLPMMPPMTPSKRVLTLFTALALALVPAAAFSATTTINARTSSWGPARTTIERGDTVKWDNSGAGFEAQEHTVKAYGGNWRKSTLLPVGTSTTKRFGDTGRFKFRCELHSVMSSGACEGMCGVVRVVRAG